MAYTPYCWGTNGSEGGLLKGNTVRPTTKLAMKANLMNTGLWKLGQAAYQPMGTTQKVKSTKDEQSSSKKSYQILEGKYKTLEQSLYTEKNEKLAAVTRVEVVDIKRRVVAQKFLGCNMIELDQLAVEEAQKGEQPAPTQVVRMLRK
ncbi:hypothetical protein FNV43_RR00204 [Rhamnella rubrinervis]|uniref:Uncharacterized protein n=1 Tax=Rhamnella rubrinervis TaxID=2594499 RepID=A0A8K0MQZ1_9ROSA|nr:hypothetical protein FNV43_RR00204 [Rhamnella rubrinervis]